MTITLRTKPGEKLIELGGGACPQIRPNCDVRQCYDANGNSTVDFTADFNEPLPITTEEFDGVFCKFALEHISYRKVPAFLKEVFRILKPGGKAVFIVPNTKEQIRWIANNLEGWDGKGLFESASCILFGDQDYLENSHKAYFDEDVAQSLFKAAGFQGVKTQPFGERETDMVIEAFKATTTMNHVVSLREANEKLAAENTISYAPGKGEQNNNPIVLKPTLPPENPLVSDRAPLFDKAYFNGGTKVGGYANEGYWDYPCHEITARKVLERRPESVLEIGAARGYILKRLKFKGVRIAGLEISKHCVMTKVTPEVQLWDVCKTPWPFKDKEFDLCFSIAVMEHIPEVYLPGIMNEVRRTCKRVLWGIDFGQKDDGFDKTHCTLRTSEWWQKNVDWSGLDVEVIEKDALEHGPIPEDYLKGDGKLKLNIGSFTTMYHNGWLNLDYHNLTQYASQLKYLHEPCDVREGLRWNTGTVDLIHCSHMLEHLTFKEGRTFLKECRRVLKPEGMMRIAVPDAGFLQQIYEGEYTGPTTLLDFGEINDGCAAAETDMERVYALLHEGHKSMYDAGTLRMVLEQAGFICQLNLQGGSSNIQLVAETLDMFPCLSLYVDAIPAI